MIPVTKSFLPPQEEFQAILHRAWSKEWITNRGELVVELEGKLKAHLGVDHLIAMTNGTLPLQIAIKILELSGEIITTPFSYVATTSSIIWENCKPVFVDIDSDYLTIDETKIEAAITEKTTAIMATHVFGNPCDVEAIDKIAKKYDLKVIYDAAHCFGVKYKGQSIFNYGDINTCSFHATKIFHTSEGGAIITPNKELMDKAFYHHNFGHNGPEKFHGLGINAKMSELQAAMGLAVFPYLKEIFDRRETIVKKYIEGLNGRNYRYLKLREGTEWNNSYFPIIFNSEKELLLAIEKLNEQQIYPRRYFYPSLNKLPYVTAQENVIAEKISRQIICLPVYFDLSLEDQNQIINTINTIH